MCPSCIPALPILVGTASGGGMIFALRTLLARLRMYRKRAEISS